MLYYAWWSQALYFLELMIKLNFASLYEFSVCRVCFNNPITVGHHMPCPHAICQNAIEKCKSQALSCMCMHAHHTERK